MSLGLSHSLSRHKLKFSPDKIDTMIVQAISLLDDLDKELNIYAMRVKEWYGWHFPEMGKIVNDNLAYARVILKMGMRTDASKADLAEILPEEIEVAVKTAAEISMGTEISPEDLENIQELAGQVVSFTEYRSQLSNYLSARMQAIAPNLTSLVGDLVGARLISHAGSLMNLAKSPASTIQILGAEKALFRALKTKHDTPKYGLLYHASLIGQATGKNKGKMARMLATKAAIGLRVDALAGDEDMTEEEKSAFGLMNREKLERRLASLEGKPIRSKGVAIAPNGNSFQPGKWEVKEARKYNHDADGLTGDEPAATAPLIEEVPENWTSKKVDMDFNGIKPLQEVIKKALEDEGVSDADSSDEEMEEPRHTSKANGVAGATNKSGALSSVSEDSHDETPQFSPQELKEQSMNGKDTKVAKRLRREEKDAKKGLLSDGNGHKKDKESEKAARRLERKTKKAAKTEKQEEGAEEQLARRAQEAGLSLVRYQRKLERGEITFGADGKATSVSKKDIKKAKKAAEKATANGAGPEGKKRKREEDVAEVNGRSEKKKKKKDKSSKA